MYRLTAALLISLTAVSASAAETASPMPPPPPAAPAPGSSAPASVISPTIAPASVISPTIAPAGASGTEAAKAAEPAKKEVPLEEQLKALDAANQAPAAANTEKLYAVQQRFLPLTWRNEFGLGYGYNMTGDSFLRSQQIQLSYRLHFNDRFAIGLSHAFVDNNFKNETNNLETPDGKAMPDVPYAYTRTDLVAEMNVFYGKFRWSPEKVSYFDIYAALGPGIIRQNNGTVGAGVGDVGFAFWLGQWGSTRLGLKDYVYNETYRNAGRKIEQNLHAHVDLGYVF